MPARFGQGFTLIELILTVSLLSFVGLLVMPFSGRFLFSQERSIARDAVEGSVAKARTYALSGKGGSAWGVALEGARLILFRGSTFATRDAAFDESFALHPRVRVVGLGEVVFLPPLGIPRNSATIVISDDTGSETLSLNAYGVLEE